MQRFAAPRSLGIFTFTLFCSLIPVAGASARTFYLSPSGDDRAPEASGATFQTLNGAIPHLWGGDTLIIKSGNFAGGVHIRRGCSPEAPLVIKAEGPYSVIRGSGEDQDAFTLNDCYNVILDGLNVTEARRGGIVLGHCKYVTVRNCTSFNNGKWGMFTDHSSDFTLEGNECYGSWREHGIYHSNSGDSFIIRNNVLHHNSGCGIHVNGDPEYGGDGVISRGIIEGNICYRNGRPLGGAGINMTHVQDVIVRNNLLYDNYAGGITFYQDTGTFAQGSKRALIVNNTVFYLHGEGRTGVNIMTSSEKVLICNNIFVSGGGRGTIEVNSEHLPSIISDNNVIWGIDTTQIVERIGERRISLGEWRKMSGNDLHTEYADPLFTNATAADFHLRQGSPAVGRGMPLEEVRRTLSRLGGFDWVLEQLGRLPDTDLSGKPRNSGKIRGAGAYGN